MTALLDHDRVVINQRAKVIELVNEYRIRDGDGADIGVIRQEGQSKLKKVGREGRASGSSSSNGKRKSSR